MFNTYSTYTLKEPTLCFFDSALLLSPPALWDSTVFYSPVSQWKQYVIWVFLSYMNSGNWTYYSFGVLLLGLG